MTKVKKISAVFLTMAILAFSSRAFAEDAMQTTMRDSVYGGIIGALVGSAVVLLTDKPDEHLSYIPTGAAVGILAGAAYGLASGTVVHSAGEVEGGRFTFNMPTIKREKIFDEKINNTEIIESVDLIKVKF